MPFSSPQPGRVPARGRRALRLGRAATRAPGVRREGRWLVGTGVAASTYPVYAGPPRRPRARRRRRAASRVAIAATDIGTGARTVLTQIAADALGVALERVARRDRRQRAAARRRSPAARSGTASWGWAVVKACRAASGCDARRRRRGRPTARAHGDDVKATGAALARHAFGAQFAEVRVDADTGEVRVRAAARRVRRRPDRQPATARSQLIGGMTMGLSMALHEESVMDAEFGDYVNRRPRAVPRRRQRRRAATSRRPGSTSTTRISTRWAPRGSARSASSAPPRRSPTPCYHATGVRVRDLPLRPDRVLAALT